jgi:serine/threonine protein phosphatase PrpC
VRTDVGRVRSVNEDRVLDRSDAGLWAIADGMGGMSAGDLAAQTAVDTLAALGSVDGRALLAALQRANTLIQAQGGGRSGATIVAAHVTAGEARIYWAGDSRAYHVRGADVRRVTRDHSYVQDLVDAGLLDEAAAEDHPRANVVTRALGVADSVEVDVVRVGLQPGDRLLLCSDGVSRSLHPADLARPEPVDALADRLLAAALDRDGSDNASLVLIEI